MYRNCRHVHGNGLRCKSPAMRRSDFCYFHSRLHGPTVELPAPKDSASIRDGALRVLRALASDRIDRERAKLMLYGLQVAAQVTGRDRSPRLNPHQSPGPPTPAREPKVKS